MIAARKRLDVQSEQLLTRGHCMPYSHNRVVETRRRVNRWLARTMPAANPFLGEGAEVAFRRKCLNELAIYVLWREHLRLADDADTERLRAILAGHLTNDYVDLACRSPKRILMFSAALSYALRAGLLDPLRRQRVAALLYGPFAWYSEWPAFRQLDLLVACRLGGVAAPLDEQDVLAVSSLAVPPCPIYSDRDAFYALCHSVVYACMLGAKLGPSDSVRAAVDGGLCRAVASQDLDLGIELVLSALILGMEINAPMAVILDRMLAAIASPETPPNAPAMKFMAIDEFVELRPTEGSWAQSCHVMIVSGLLLAFMEARGIDLSEEPEAERVAFAHRVGAAFLALHAYQIRSGLDLALALTARTPLESAHLRRICEFVDLNRRDTAQYGLFVEERALFQAAYPHLDFDANVRAQIDTICAQFLARQAADVALLQEV